MKLGFKINLDIHHNNHANSKLTFSPNYPELVIEDRYFIKILKELSVFYARLMNQYKFKYQTAFSAGFGKQDEGNQVLDETELFINININHNLTESDLENLDVRPPLEHQIQQQEMKDSGWTFDKINSNTIYFYKTGDLNGSNCVKIPLKSNAILNIEISDNFCFLLSILAYLHLCNNNHPNRVSIYKHYFDEMSLERFDFTNGFKCNDVHKFNELNNLSINTFESNFYQDQNEWKHELILIEVDKSDSDRVIDLVVYRNQYVLIKNLKVILGDHNKTFICRRCLSSYTSENMLVLLEQKCGDDNKTTIRTAPESHTQWKEHFHKSLFIFEFIQTLKLTMEKIFLV